MKQENLLDPINVIMGILAIVGAILIIIGQGNYGLIFLVITTLIGAIMRLFK